MKLYSLDHSPYSTRVRIQVAHGQLPVSVEPPPAPLRTPEFIERFPLGKLPVLELEDGTHLSDSWVIMEYLDQAFPGMNLIPGEAMARAHMQSIARCADTCLGPGGIFPLFSGVANPAEGGHLLEGLGDEISRLERLLATQNDLSERSLHLGDIALAPHISYACMLAPMFGQADILTGHEMLAGWWNWVWEQTAVAAELNVMESAAKAFFSR